jgi:hypothetical protein
LGVPIEHFGHFKVGDFKKFELRLATSVQSVAAKPTSDFFAPAEFFELSQDERMTRKSYENFNAGLEAEGLDNLLSGGFREMPVSHERKMIDDEAPPERKTVPLPPLHFVAQVRGNAVARSQHGQRVARTVRKDFSLRNERFNIVKRDNLGSFDPAQAALGSEAEAQIALNNFVQQNPAQKDQLVVVPLWEIG